MPDFRGDIRRAIFTKVRDKSIDIIRTSETINDKLIECSKRYKDFEQLEKLNIELTVPIQLPPNGKKGDCKKVILEVQKSFNELGGGSRVYHALGSWLDGQKKVVSEQCAVIYSAMSIGNWYECIPVLQRLIRDEIQTKLFQECVFLRIDNQTYGEPLFKPSSQQKSKAITTLKLFLEVILPRPLEMVLMPLVVTSPSTILKELTLKNTPKL